MNYYPKSQITPNLTSNGNLAIKSSNKPYYGKYYATSTGKYYVGENPSSTQIELIFLDEFPTLEIESENFQIDLRFGTKSNYEYSTLTNLSNTSPLTPPPPPYYSSPTGEEVSIGEYRRYFAKKTNELIYIEISKETYTKFKSNDPTVASDLYECLFLPWNIDGNPEVNIKIVSQIERNNEWYGFTSYFRGNFG